MTDLTLRRRQRSGAGLRLAIAHATTRRTPVRIGLLGGFCVAIDGVPVPDAAWTRRQATTLVKLLALAERRRLHREQIIDALWPDAAVAEAAPRLHKLAHYVRRVLGPRGVVLHHDLVRLCPDTDLVVDVDRFEQLADAALRRRDPAAAARACAAYAGELLPEHRYDDWATEQRERLHEKYLRVRRLAAATSHPMGNGREGWGKAESVRSEPCLPPTR